MKTDWRIMGMPITTDQNFANEIRSHHKDVLLACNFSSREKAEEALRLGIEKGEYRATCYVKSQQIRDDTEPGRSSIGPFIIDLHEAIKLSKSTDLATEINTNDTLTTTGDKMTTIKGKIKSIKAKGTTTTYDIGVADNHNFFANGVLVHNCQHDAASSMTHLHNMLLPDMILGMSATPFRTDRVKLCFDSVVTDIGIHQLIQSGYLSKFHHYTIDQFNVDTVATHYLSERQRWGKSIFYFLTHDECESLAMKLRSADVTCEVVTGSSDVESQLAGFRNGNVQCLINCMKLTEGFNDPSLRTAWVRDSSRGPTIQMAGRAFRKFEGVEYKQVVQSKNTDWPIIRTAIPDEQYQWSVDSWRMLKINPAIEQITQNCRMAIASMDVKLPPMLGKLKSERRRINRDRRV